MRRRSLTWRIVIGISGCVIAVAVAASILLHMLFKKQMLEQEDRELALKLVVLQGWAFQEEKWVKFNIDDEWWKRIHDENDPEYFQFRFASGRSSFRSRNLSSKEDLPMVGAGSTEFEYADFILPTGEAGRCVGTTFVCKVRIGDRTPVRMHLVVAHSNRDISETLASLRLVIAGISLVAAVALIGVAYSFVRRILRPLSDLSGQIEDVSVRALGHRFELRGAAEEIKPVVDRLNALMGRVDGAIENERRFTTNAAHELRNPIAAIRTQLEYALTDSRSEEDYRELIDSALEVEKGVQRTVENLLLLARLESGNERVAAGEIDIPSLLRRAWRPFFENAEGKDLRVEWDCAEEIPTIHSSQTLLEIVLRNLFENAVDYTDQGGCVRVSANVDPEKREATFSVANAPTDLRSEDVPNIFRRFWRAPGRRDAGHAHSGIGLSLCRRIADVLDGEITATLDDGNSTLTICFEMALKEIETD